MKCLHCGFEDPEWIKLIDDHFACSRCITPQRQNVMMQLHDKKVKEARTKGKRVVRGKEHQRQQVLMQLHDKDVISIETLCKELGINYDEEVARMEDKTETLRKEFTQELCIDYEKEKDMVVNTENTDRVEYRLLGPQEEHEWAMKLARQCWEDPLISKRQEPQDCDMAKVIADTICLAVTAAHDVLITDLSREKRARGEAERQAKNYTGAVLDNLSIRLAIESLSGDLSYDGVARAKKILTGLVGASKCSVCGCDCSGCGCSSGCCTKCGCCKGWFGEQI